MEKVSLLFLFPLCSRYNDSRKVLSISYCQGLCIIILPVAHSSWRKLRYIDVLCMWSRDLWNFLLALFLKLFYYVRHRILQSGSLLSSVCFRASFFIICYLYFLLQFWNEVAVSEKSVQICTLLWWILKVQIFLIQIVWSR